MSLGKFSRLVKFEVEKFPRICTPPEELDDRGVGGPPKKVPLIELLSLRKRKQSKCVVLAPLKMLRSQFQTHSPFVQLH